MKPNPHQLTSNVKLLHKVVVKYDNKILVLKRSSRSTSRPDCWDLPGGNSEWPANQPSGFDYHQQDISREIKEEIDLAVDPNHFTNHQLIYFHSYLDTHKHIYTLICGWYLNLNQLPAINLSREHSEHLWIEPSLLSPLDFGGPKGRFIQDIISSAV